MPGDQAEPRGRPKGCLRLGVFVTELELSDSNARQRPRLISGAPAARHEALQRWPFSRATYRAGFISRSKFTSHA